MHFMSNEFKKEFYDAKKNNLFNTKEWNERIEDVVAESFFLDLIHRPVEFEHDGIEYIRYSNVKNNEVKDKIKLFNEYNISTIVLNYAFDIYNRPLKTHSKIYIGKEFFVESNIDAWKLLYNDLKSKRN